MPPILGRCTGCVMVRALGSRPAYPRCMARTLLSLLLLSLCLSCTREPPEPAAAPTSSASGLTASGYLFVTLTWGDSGLAVTEWRRVEGELPRQRRPVEQAWRLELVDVEGRVAWTKQLVPANQVRGEIEGDGGALKGVHVTQSEATLGVAVPAEAVHGTLRLMGEAWTLPEGDPRRAGREPYSWVELGRATIEERP